MVIMEIHLAVDYTPWLKYGPLQYFRTNLTTIGQYQ